MNPHPTPARAPVINALGMLSNINLMMGPRPDAPPLYGGALGAIDARALQDLRASGLHAVNLTLGSVAGDHDHFEATVRAIADCDALIRAQPQALRKVFSVADIDAAQAQGQTGVIQGFQNTLMLGDDLARVRLFARLGVRVIQLTYNGRNAVGDGATVTDDQGLSEFGRTVVARLQQEGVLVDLSHSSEKTCLDTLAMATKPVAITHTGCRGLVDHPRNKSDTELRLLAQRGGVVGIYAMPYLRLQGQPLAADWVAHIEHALQVCGEDHVGLGTDGCVTAVDDVAGFRAVMQRDVEHRRATGIGAPGESADVVVFLPDLQGPGQFQGLAALLAHRGHSASRIDKILGGNFRRLFAQAWA